MANQPTPLPEQPSLAYLKKLAKQRLADVRVDEPDAKLSDVQYAIASEHGFASWRALKAHVDKLDAARIEPWLAAVQAGDVDKCAAMLDENPDWVHTRLNHNRTALHDAAMNHHFELGKLLVERGADIHARCKGDNATPLHFASERGPVELMQLLIDAGADVNASGDLHLLGVIGWASCFTKSPDRKLVGFLLANGAKHHVLSAIACDDMQALEQYLADQPQEIHRRMSKFEQFRTPLHFAVWCGRHAMIERLCELGAELAAVDEKGRTPLAQAIMQEDDRAEQILRDHGSPEPSEVDAKVLCDQVIPILGVSDVGASIDHYVNVLGFGKGFVWPPDKPKKHFASVGRGSVTIFFDSNEPRVPGVRMWISVDDVDQLHAEFVERGANIKETPANRPWGMREISVVDPDGNILRFASANTEES